MLRLSASGPPARLLDIGSGAGEFAADVRVAFPDSEIVGLELSATGVELARQRVPGAEFIQRDLLEPASLRLASRDGRPTPSAPRCSSTSSNRAHCSLARCRTSRLAVGSS